MNPTFELTYEVEFPNVVSFITTVLDRFACIASGMFLLSKNTPNLPTSGIELGCIYQTWVEFPTGGPRARLLQRSPILHALRIILDVPGRYRDVSHL